MKNIAKRSAASRKGWRSRKRMEQARKQTLGERMQATIEDGSALTDLEKRWPRWKQNALPNPWMQ